MSARTDPRGGYQATDIPTATIIGGLSLLSSLDMTMAEYLPSVAMEGRMTTIEKQTTQRMAVLQGTLDMLVSRTLLYGPAHGHQIGAEES
jgi:hypothetical protein